MSNVNAIFLSGNLSAKWGTDPTVFESTPIRVDLDCPCEVLAYCCEQDPCILIVDCPFIEKLRLETFYQYVRDREQIRVLVELDEEPMEQVEGLIRMGCFGCLNKEASIFEAQLAVQSVRSGEIWASRKLVSHILRSMQHEAEKLTSREQEIVTLVSGGLTNDEIASRLFISGQTVRWHLRRLYKKLGTHDRRSLKLNGLLAEHAPRPTRRSASPEQTLIRSVSTDPQNNQRAFTSVSDSLLGRLTK